jgi:hypothetical protein
MKVILLLLLSVLSVGAQMPPRVMQDLLSYRPPTGPGEFLTDRWYFSNVTETNDAPFAIGFEGTGTRIVDWGDGQSTTTNGTCVVTHTYSTAGSNVFSVRESSGATTRLYFYNLTGSVRLKRILTTPKGMGSLASLSESFRNCTSLTGSIPDISGLTNLTTLYYAWQGCTGLTGSIPDISGLTNLTTIAAAWYGCTGLTGSIPDISGLTKLTTIASAWRGCTGLTGSIPDISGLTNLTTLAYTWYNCTGLTGSIPDISGLTNLTTIAIAWQSCTGLTGSIPDISALTNLTTIAYAWNGCTGLTGSIPDISGLTKLTSIDSAFQNTRLTANTNTVAQIFGLLSRTNLTSANQAFSAASGAYASLVGNAGDFIALEKSASFVTNTSSSSGSYRMFFNQTNLADYATIPADWK